MKYTNRAPKKRWPRRLFTIAVVAVAIVVVATVGVRYVYDQNLKPVSSNQSTQQVTINEGATVDQIATQLQGKALIRSAWAFKLYVSSKEVRSDLQAGTYNLSPSLSVAEIVSELTHGKVATDLVTILPGQRLDQIRQRLIQSGFSQADVDAALNPVTYPDHPALVDKPASASLEGYLYPDSYQKTANTSAQTIVKASLDEMSAHLTPDLRNAFGKQGLSTYQAITLASVIEKEVSKPSDREQVAQIFLKRLRTGVRLQSDATAFYGAILAGQKPSVDYDSPYNTYKHDGLPPTPIGNVSDSSLRAVAYPANTDWLYFLTDDQGVVRYAQTYDQHQANVHQYCTQSCAQ